jgi:hypothetical protein
MVRGTNDITQRETGNVSFSEYKNRSAFNKQFERIAHSTPKYTKTQLIIKSQTDIGSRINTGKLNSTVTKQKYGIS